MMHWRNLRAALRGERGNATVEFVVWLPFFIILLGAIADVSLLLNNQSRMFDVARDASRLVSLGRMTNIEAEAWARNSLEGRPLDVQVTVLNGFVTTKVLLPYSDVLVFGRGLMGDSKVEADMTMVMEVAEATEEGV